MSLTVAQLVARVTADTSGFYKSMAVANSSMIRTGGIISRVVAGSTLAIGAMGILSLRAAGNFQQSMNIVQAVAQPTKAQFKALGDEAIALGKDMKLPNVSAKDAADAMAELSKAGLSVNDVLKATRGTLQLGLASNTGFADSAAVVARSLTAFGLEGSHAIEVADLFTAAANKSTAEMTDVALGFQMASANFKRTDQTIQGLTTSITLMANAGVVGSDAGTSLKTMMNRLTAPTKKAAGLMKDLGFEVYDASGNVKEMPDIIGDLNTSLRGMSKEQKNAALYTIFGSDAIRAASIQLDVGEKGWRKMEASLIKGGEAAQMTEARTKGLNGAFQAAGSAVETFAIILGTAMLPAAEAAVRAFANFVSSIDPDKIIAFFTAIKDGIVAFKDFVASSTAAQYILAGLAGAIVGLFVAAKLVAIFRSVQIAWQLLNAAFLFSPIGLIIVGIAALIGALVLAYFKIEAFRNAVNTAFSWMKEHVTKIFQDISEGIKRHWDEIKDTFFTALNVIRTWWELTWGRIVNFVIANWQKIFAVIKAVANNIIIMVKGFLKTIEGVINLFMGIIHGDWGRAWQGIKQILDGVWGTMLRMLINTLTKIVPAVLHLAIAIGKAVLTGIGQALSTLANFVWNKLMAIPRKLSEVASKAPGWAAAIGRAIITGIVSGLKNLATDVGNKIIGGVTGAVDSAMGVFGRSPQKEIGYALADGVIKAWLEGIGDLPDKITDSIRKALEAGKRVIDEYKSVLSAAFSDLANEATIAFDAVTAAHKTAAEKALAAFDAKQAKEALKKQMQELRATLAEEQKKLAEMKPPELVQKEGESAEEFKARVEKETADYLAELADQGEKVKEAQQAIDDELKARSIARKRAKLEAEAEQSRVDYEQQRRLKKKRLDQELQDLEEALAKHPEKHRIYQAKIIKLLNSYGITYAKAGKLLGQSFAGGLEDALSDVIAAANLLAQAVANILKLGSPAKEGPLSDLNKWWKPFADTLLSSFEIDDVNKKLMQLEKPVKLWTMDNTKPMSTERTSPSTQTTPTPASSAPTTITIEEQHIHNDIDPIVVATTLGRKLAYR